ncbi:FtsH protease activity modulator HflK [Gilliamella sp. B2894]|uniref:FtsH protease activity modulator HflK n=1 Tax=unclassified Gilliamella TaxID=2685620 RepID=UPI00226A6C4D|nr:MULTISPECIES: FtsH protease activity modulator HflK [unclassified Gilliamella]MCX8656267.1 FtsH protease activity modulator HflK [Gilliamella sp. B2894]MCX8694021.1 FtsH protease activity modulator HflK [Gilliamella sp. B2881]MCX8696292.1 FtsH protease activity modulator HflK [Gilliamella sp. B2828]
MAWNQPGNNGQDNDPWGSNNKKPSNSTNDILDKIKNLLKKGKLGNNNGGSSNTKLPMNTYKIIVIAFIALIFIWGLSGFYTINQSQRGVITRFGQVQPEIVQPGLNWKPTLIDKVYIVDTQGTRNFNVQGFIVTTGENLVFVEMNVQYRISNPLKYLFNVTNVEDSLRQAADSALRTAVGSSNIDAIISDGRSILESSTKDELVNVITHYDMGINIVDLNFQVARPPDEVQDAYDDAIRAQGDSEREIKQAEADKVQLVQQAEGKSARILADANAYKVRVELEAAGDVARFEQILPQYKAAPEITKERLYIEMMEKILEKTHKVIVNDKSGNLMVLPLEQLLKNKGEKVSTSTVNQSSDYNFNMPNSSEAMKSTPQTASESQKSATTSNNSSSTSNTARTMRTMGQ